MRAGELLKWSYKAKVNLVVIDAGTCWPLAVHAGGPCWLFFEALRLIISVVISVNKLIDKHEGLRP